MGPKQRSILLLIAVFILGSVTGYFARGFYSQYSAKSNRQRVVSETGNSRFVRYFTRVINPSEEQKRLITPILEKWGGELKALQKTFTQESEGKYKSMIGELGPHLNPDQLHHLKEALERSSHRKRSRSTHNRSAPNTP